MTDTKCEIETLQAAETLGGVYYVMNKETRLLLDLDGGRCHST